jgi:ATP-dependent DNA helicase RecQ
MEALALLKQHFGYDSFRRGQQEIIAHIKNGEDILAIMPTGAGKSVCYQVPALLANGITIVISPLISLMKDQVDSLKESGIKAAYINSSLSALQIEKVIQNVRNGEYKIIYVAPERLEAESFRELVAEIQVYMIAVDEAHCVSQWGHDFRPSYTKITQLTESFKQRPIVAAFTATATELVKEDIKKLLCLKAPFELTTGFDRENLFLEVAKPASKFEYLLYSINLSGDNSGIVYCSTRKTVESVCEKLNTNGYKAVKYHAGLSERERTENQELFIYDKVPIMIATNAFGMGIDKSNLRFVVHYNMPKTIENYYQEAGRAGRDGEAAKCTLLYSAADIITNKFLIEIGGDNSDKTNEYKKLAEMVDYCNTDGCLRRYILSYFGEKTADDECGNCSNCNSDIERTDITVEAQKILSCIKRMNERFGSGIVLNVLRGSKSEKIVNMGFDKLTTYGIMKDYPIEVLRDINSFLIAEGYIKISNGEYPTLSLDSSAYEVLTSKKSVYIRRAIKKHQQKTATRDKFVAVDSGLFTILREVRRQIASEEHVAPFIIFSDVSLNDMCRKYPCTPREFLNVSGVGEHKLRKFGDRFIAATREYVAQNNIKVQVFNVAEQPRQRQSSVKEPQKHTSIITYELFCEGKSVGDIATERELSQDTIEGHLLDCYIKGMPVDYRFVNSPELEPLIIDAINKCGTEKLKPIKELLPQEVTYTAIRFVIYNYDKSEEEC